MEFTIVENGTSLEVALSGSFSFADNDKVLALVNAFDTSEKKRTTVSLERLESIDSAGLGMLIILNDAAQLRGVGFSIRGARGQVKRMLEITEFDSMVQVDV